MPTSQFATEITMGSLRISSRATRSQSGLITHELTSDTGLLGGQAGTLTTYTDESNGVATLGADHGITQSSSVDVFWPGGLRYGMTAATVSGPEVTLSGGSGDDLPSQDTEVIVSPRTELVTAFAGDDVDAIAAWSDTRMHLLFADSTDAALYARELVAGEDWHWITGRGLANPLAGMDVAKLFVSVGAATPGELKLGVQYDSTPA